MSFLQDGKIILENKFGRGEYFDSINNWIEKSDKGDKKSQELIARQLSREFEMLSMQGRLIFGFKYTNNLENRLRGRVGRFSGWRQGTRRLKLIPNNKRPISVSKEPTCIRYYDISKMSWRSFKKGLFVVATSFYNEREQKWVDTPEEANFRRTWINDNWKYDRVDRMDTQEELKARQKIQLKEQVKREKQIQQTAKKLISGTKNLIRKSFDQDLLSEADYFGLNSKIDGIEKSNKSEQITLLPYFINRLRSILNKGTITTKGCLMLNIQEDSWNEFIEAYIDPKDLSADGLDYEPHCTILYGLNDDTIDIQKLKEFICEFIDNNVIDVKVKNIDIFETEDYDVVKFSLESEGLRMLNALIRANFDYQNNYPDYKPHVTIAYVNKGCGKKYCLDVKNEVSFELKNVVYSSSNREKEIIYTFD